jgi:tetratricopeptide (TPR) repeat protein
VNNLGYTLQAQGDLVGARAYYEQALAIRERVLGPDHPDTAESINGLGTLLQGQGDYRQAQMYLERALVINEQVLGPSHPTTAQSLRNLGVLLQDQANPVAARPLLERALAVTERIEAADQIEIIIQNDLALLLQELGETEKARTYFKRVLASIEARLDTLFAGDSKGQQAIINVLALMNLIVKEIEIIYTSRSQLSRTAAVGRIIKSLSDLQTQLGVIPQIEQVLVRSISNRWDEIVTREAGRVGSKEILEEVTSPYIFTAPVRGAALVGREDLFKRITSLWARAGQRNSLLIHGHRRMGKTSLAQAIVERSQLGSDTQLIYQSLEGQAISHGGDLYFLLASRIWLRFRNILERPQESEFAGMSAGTQFILFMEMLNEVVGNTRLVLVLDEFEWLYRKLGAEVAHEIIRDLRNQTQTYSWLALALVGLSDLDDLRLSYDSALLGWESIRVSFLEAPLVASVLANPPNNPDFPLDYAPEALERIASLTYGQPYLVQVIGDLLVQRYNQFVFTEQRTHNGIFSVLDVQAVVDDPGFYDMAAAYFRGIWGQAGNGQPGEQAILRVLASHKDGLSEAVLAAAVALDAAAFRIARDALKRHEVIMKASNRWQYTVPLMRQWVKKIQLKTTSVP